MSGRSAHRFPFSAVVGQETLKTALLLNAVDPRVGGLLVRGRKGTAKSTVVRALAGVLPPLPVVDGCPFSCDPADPAHWCSQCRSKRDSGQLPRAQRAARVVDLPVSATEDRLVGTLDLEHALKHGERRFEPGLLARANRGVLYVDEVNLLDDHLVDTLLDAAAMGENVVEREGVSFTHPSRFILVGTMNPEEGEVRPQLLDRFGLCVEVEGLTDARQRVEIVRRRQAFEDDHAGFARTWNREDEELTVRIKTARDRLGMTVLPDDLLFLIASICAEVGVEGHRADIVMARASSALAALEGRQEVLAEDIRRVAPLVLAHRLRRRPFEDQPFDEQRLVSVVSQAMGESGGSEPGESHDQGSGAGAELSHALTVMSAREVEHDAPAEVPSLQLTRATDTMRRTGQGKRHVSKSGDHRGRTVRTTAARSGEPTDMAIGATLRAAAPHQQSRRGDMAIQVEPGDVHNKVRQRRVGATIVFCVDASGSMGASLRMEAAKTAILELLVEAYQRRDRVGLVTFRGTDAEVLLSPTSSVELAQMKLRTMPTGGATPLAHGIKASLEVLARETRRDDSVIPWLVLVTDGRANVGIGGGLGSEDARTLASRVRQSGVHALVIDTNNATSSANVGRDLARLAGGEYVRLERLAGQDMAQVVRARLG